MWCDGCNDDRGWETPNGNFVGKIGNDGHPYLFEQFDRYLNKFTGNSK